MDSTCTQGLKPVITYWLGCSALFLMDYFSKQWAVQSLSSIDNWPVVQNFLKLQLAHNTGAAWSLLSSHTEWVAFIGSIFCTGLILYSLFKLPKELLLRSGLCLILAGATGNLFDRLTQGYVTDFIDLDLIPNYPIFNLADCWIVIGTAFIIFDTVKQALTNRSK